LLDVVPEERLREILASLASATAAVLDKAPSHDSYFKAS
jgi:hypothetical protein